MALATARSGTRSKKSPALPRTTRFCDVDGDHANPTRGDTLLVSVLMVSQELQVVAQAEIQRQARRDTPLVLRVHADVRVRLRHDRIAERLREAAVVADEEVRHRRERVVAAERSRIRDGVVVEHEVDAGAQRVRARLVREVVHDLIHPCSGVWSGCWTACRTMRRRRC